MSPFCNALEATSVPAPRAGEAVGDALMNSQTIADSNPDRSPAGSVAGSGAVEIPGQQPQDVAEPVLFFDGVCGLCNRFVDFTMTRDHARRIRFSPLQGETARARLEPHDIASLDSVVLLDEEGAHRRSAAVVRVLRHFSLGWRILAGVLWLIPRPLRDLGYKLVAANRYRMFGKKDACRLPTPDERSRFLP